MTSTPTATPDSQLDLRFEIPEAPEHGFQWVTEDMVVAAGEEQQWCFFTTYTGPDVGVNQVLSYQTSQGGHHAIILLTNASEEEFPDGAVFDCTDRDTLPMTDTMPFYIGADSAVDTERGTINVGMNLPDGMASSLKSGSRLMLQSHFVNYSNKPILVRDVVNVTTIPAEEVEVWTAPWIITDVNFELPPTQASSLTLDCEWTEDTDLLFLLGHMHEYGSSISIDREIPGEDPYSLYEIPEWLPEFRDAAPVDSYLDGEMHIAAGEKFQVTCNWFNDSDGVVVFPSEMCVATGMAYPAKVSIFPSCNVGEVVPN